MDNEKFRLESDSVGEKQVPIDALYGVQTLRGHDNFQITGLTLHPAMVKALAEIKKACAIANCKAGVWMLTKPKQLKKHVMKLLKENIMKHFLQTLFKVVQVQLQT